MERSDDLDKSLPAARAQRNPVDTSDRLPGEFRPGDIVQPATKTPSRRMWTVISRVNPGRDSWFVRDENGLRSCVNGSDLRLYVPAQREGTADR
ncbi:MAG: hypothetical protein JWN96_2278 [Mycobacterium sp.]|nr:hypothetical protein [Mycobacterium sp.]